MTTIDIATLPVAAEAVPKFLAGFFYGMTKENHLQEIEACYEGAEIMYPEIQFALSELHKDGWDDTAQAILEFGIVALQIPQALHTCASIGDDVKAFEQWASIFLNPAELSKTVALHLSLHRKAIKADIVQDKAQWDAQEWFAAGVTTADLATLAIGPIKPVYPTMYVNEINMQNSGFDPLAVPDFVAGMIYGFTGDNQLTEIEACFNGSQQLYVDAQNLITDLENQQWAKAIVDNATFATQLEAALKTCQGMDEDFAAIEAWAQIFTEPVQLTETVTKNWLLHKRGIKKDTEQAKLDWDNGLYFNSGVDTADALVKLIGPVE